MQPEVGAVCRKIFTPEIRSISEKDRTIDFIASTEATDRYGDVIRVAGWETANYMKNPVFLWAHRSSEPPIGKCIDIRKESSPAALVQKIQFADAATYPFADTIFNLYRGKFLRAVSVGFLPLEMPKRIKNEQDETTGWEFANQELLELSAVPVPANPEAVARMVSKGFGSEADLRRVFCGEARNVERELAELSIAVGGLAVSIATAIVRRSQEQLAEALRNVRGSESNGEMTLEEFLAIVRHGGERLGSIEQFGEELEASDEITTLDELAGVLGVSDGKKYRDIGRLPLRE